MAPVSSRIDRTTSDHQHRPHGAWSHDATRYPPVPPHGMAIRYPSAMELAPSNILQTNTTCTPSHGNQTHEKRRMPGLRRIDDLPIGYTPGGAAPYPESYNHDQRHLQEEVPLNMNIPRTQPHHVDNTVSPNVQKAYFGNASDRILPNLGSDPMNRMYHENSSATSGSFSQANSVIGNHQDLQGHILNYPLLPSTSTSNLNPLYTTTDRRYISHPNIQENNSGRPGNISVKKFAGAQSNARTASYTGTLDQTQKTFNFHPQIAEQFSTQLVQDYLNYLICNGYQLHVLRAQKFLSLKYRDCKDLANSSNSFSLNELAKIMLTSQRTPQKIIPEVTPAATHASAKPSPVKQPYEILQNLHNRQHFAEASIINGQRQNMLANTTSFSTQHSSNLFNSTQTPQNSTFPPISGRNTHRVTTQPVPTVVKISPTVGTNNMNRRPHLHGVTKKPMPQKYNHSTVQIPYSVARNISSEKSTAENKPLPHIDLTVESQDILEDKINTMQITTEHPTQCNAKFPVTDINLLQNANTQKINADQETAVIYENEGLIISCQNSLSPAIQESKANESLRTLLNATKENALEVKSSDNNSQVNAKPNTSKRSILPLANNSDTKDEPSSSKPHDTDNIKVNINEKNLPPVHKTTSENSPSNKSQMVVENILPANNRVIELKKHGGIPILQSTHQNPSENMSSNKPLVEAHMVNGQEKSPLPESETDTEEIDIQNPLLPENQSLEQEPITEEEFLDEFTSLLNQLDSHNSSTNELFGRLRGLITKSTETADSLKKVFSVNVETSDDTVTSTTSSEPV